jgi:hypothetical protein
MVVPTTHVVSCVAILFFFPLRVIEIQKYRKLRAHNNTKLYLPIYVYNMYICIYNTGYYTLLLYMGVGWLEDIHI